MKKVVLGVMMFLGVTVVLSNVWTTLFLSLDLNGVSSKDAIEGSIVSNGLAIVSLAVTVWLGISIYNAIEKKEIQELKLTLEKYSPLSEQMREYVKQQLTNQMYQIGEVSSDSLAKRFENDKEIPLERYADILTIDILMEKIYKNREQVSERKVLEWTNIGIERINKYKGKFRKRYDLEKCYLDYREGDFYFSRGRATGRKEKYEAYRKSKNLFLKAQKGFGVSLSEVGFNELTEMEQRLSVYFANVIGHCYANVINGIEDAEVKNKMREEAYRHLEFAVKMSKRCGEIETYYRNYGCLIENTTGDIAGLEQAYEQYKMGLKVNSKGKDTYYVLISNLNKRIRGMLGIEIRVPEKDRQIPLWQMQFGKIKEKKKIDNLIQEMKNYIEIAICLFPNEPRWYAFSVYRRIYKMCLQNEFELNVVRKYLYNMRQDVMKVDMLEGKQPLCVVVRKEVADLNEYVKRIRC